MKKLKKRLINTFIKASQANETNNPMQPLDTTKDALHILTSTIYALSMILFAIAHTIVIIPIITTIIYLLLALVITNYFYKLKNEVFQALQKEPNLEDFIKGFESLLNDIENESKNNEVTENK